MSPDSSGQLELQTADTTRMTIDVNGNVGIGTNVPQRRLDLRSSTSCEQIIGVSSAATDGKYWNLLVDGGSGGSTKSSFTIRLLNDSFSDVAGSGITINGTTNVFSTRTNNAINPASVPTGSVIQTQWTNLNGFYTGASASNVDFTNFYATFTPKLATSKVLVIVSAGVNFVCDGAVYLKRNGSIVKDHWFGSSRQDDVHDWPQATQLYLDSPATTSTITYQLGGRATGCGNVIRFGASDNSSSMTIMEIAA